eukprot:TRINITY_DN782050_c0_g1_i1.p1 TRINITY_DN782050_c0_g1~~TRINITY_DN782050_c0_g1_i1.p1  ORF type:complete len:431 (-),score=133.79 TRINITY_DN782050_c0_g1_i1:184-1476(-)
MNKHIILLALAIICAVSAKRLIEYSILPPLQTFDSFGQREVAYWQNGGDAVINEHFVRLTPDRASKRGWLWNTEPMSFKKWSATIKFRISGQGQRLFGDGLGFWVTSSPQHRDGHLYGTTESYEGFSVLFDTFRNTEDGHVHKDISLLVDNGERVGLDTDPDRPGCTSEYRYWEKRDDFSVDNISLAKITYDNGVVTLVVDPHGEGIWSDCFVSKNLLSELPKDWTTTDLYLGLSASTGQLADNHDIVSVVFNSLEEDSDEDTDDAPIEEFEDEIKLDLPNDATGSVIATALNDYAKDQKEKLRHLHHHLEYQLSSVHDSLRHTLAKIKAQEEENLERIVELERRLGADVNSKIQSSLQERLAAIEEKLHMKVANQMETEVQTRITTEVGKVGKSSAGWIVPFSILTIILVGVGIYCYQKYKYLMKRHLL